MTLSILPNGLISFCEKIVRLYLDLTLLKFPFEFMNLSNFVKYHQILLVTFCLMTVIR